MWEKKGELAKVEVAEECELRGGVVVVGRWRLAQSTHEKPARTCLERVERQAVDAVFMGNVVPTWLTTGVTGVPAVTNKPRTEAHP